MARPFPFVRLLSLCLWVAASLSLPLSSLRAETLTVWSSGGYTASLEKLAPEFEKATGHKNRDRAWTLDGHRV